MIRKVTIRGRPTEDGLCSAAGVWMDCTRVLSLRMSGRMAKTGKPFLLPQKEADYYAGLMKSYNIPEFVTGKVTNRSYQIRRLAEQAELSVSCSTF